MGKVQSKRTECVRQSLRKLLVGICHTDLFSTFFFFSASDGPSLGSLPLLSLLPHPPTPRTLLSTPFQPPFFLPCPACLLQYLSLISYIFTDSSTSMRVLRCIDIAVAFHINHYRCGGECGGGDAALCFWSTPLAFVLACLLQEQLGS